MAIRMVMLWMTINEENNTIVVIKTIMPTFPFRVTPFRL
jgi:hypothetical protein